MVQNRTFSPKRLTSRRLVHGEGEGLRGGSGGLDDGARGQPSASSSGGVDQVGRDVHVDGPAPPGRHVDAVRHRAGKLPSRGRVGLSDERATSGTWYCHKVREFEAVVE